MQLPLLEGLKFKNEKIRASIEHTMTAQDEVHIQEFLQQEVEPVLNHLQKNNSKVQEIVDDYFNMVNDSTGVLYHYRCEYEDTLTTINDMDRNSIVILKEFGELGSRTESRSRESK